MEWLTFLVIVLDYVTFSNVVYIRDNLSMILPPISIKNNISQNVNKYHSVMRASMVGDDLPVVNEVKTIP